MNCVSLHSEVSMSIFIYICEAPPCFQFIKNKYLEFGKSLFGGLWLFSGGLWSFAGGLWSFVVVACFSNYVAIKCSILLLLIYIQIYYIT